MKIQRNKRYIRSNSCINDDIVLYINGELVFSGSISDIKSALDTASSIPNVLDDFSVYLDIVHGDFDSSIRAIECRDIYDDYYPLCTTDEFIFGIAREIQDVFYANSCRFISYTCDTNFNISYDRTSNFYIGIDGINQIEIFLAKDDIK